MELIDESEIVVMARAGPPMQLSPHRVVLSGTPIPGSVVGSFASAGLFNNQTASTVVDCTSLSTTRCSTGFACRSASSAC
jgi:hypothetical protein